MTTWTSEDKEEAYRKKVEDAPYHQAMRMQLFILQ